MLAALKIAPALCAGNTLVLKAAEDAPLGVLWLARICQELLPKGVLNVVTGYGEEAGAALSAHPGVRKLSFTGSTEVGKLIMRAASERIVPVSLELGGKSPSIVYPDANEDWVVDGIIAAMRFTRQSQSCTAGSRLFLHADIFDDFLGKLGGEDVEAQDRRSARRGDRHRRHHQREAVQEGVRLRRGGHEAAGRQAAVRRPAAEDRAAVAGLFRHPDRVRQRRQRLAPGARGDLRPRAGRHPLDRRGRGHPHGQRHATTASPPTCGRTTSAGRCAPRTRIEAGWVQVNQGLGQSPGHSYGGIKQSGIGREFSLEGMLDSFTQRKNVTVNLNTPSRA